jgi:hypothetical protein
MRTKPNTFYYSISKKSMALWIVKPDPNIDGHELWHLTEIFNDGQQRKAKCSAGIVDEFMRNGKFYQPPGQAE